LKRSKNRRARDPADCRRAPDAAAIAFCLFIVGIRLEPRPGGAEATAASLPL
jgi:hypothetical protein